jgi:hypothetical protein
MDPSELFERAADPRYIEGIYNYCDRWCERCPFTARCLNYSMSEEYFTDPETHDINNQAFWDTLTTVFEDTHKLILACAEKHGIDLSDIDDAPEDNAGSSRRKNAETHPLTQTAHAYMTLVDDWFSAYKNLFSEKELQLHALAGINADDTEPAQAAAEIKDALEVIGWYKFFIKVKLMRALTRFPDYDDPDIIAAQQSDANGSAKIALVAIDRSIGAWGTLQQHFNNETDSILDILLHLDRLRRNTESTFPDARAFKRPGFDEEVPVINA